MRTRDVTSQGEALLETTSLVGVRGGPGEEGFKLGGDAVGQEIRVRDAVHRRTLALSDLIAALVAMSISVTAMHGSPLTVGSVALLAVITLSGKLTGLYDQDNLVLHKSTLDEAPLLFAVATVYALIFGLLDHALLGVVLTHVELAVLWGSLFALLFAGRVAARMVLPRVTRTERCLLIGEAAMWSKLEPALSGRGGTRLVSHMSIRGRDPGRGESLSAEINGCLPRLRRQVQEDRIHRVIIALRESGFEDILDCVFALKRLGLKVSVVPSLLEVVGSAVVFEDVDGLPVLGIRQFGLSRSSAIVKRAFDLAVSAVVLVLFSPLLLAIAVAVRLSSDGPACFRQQRVGRDGELFDLIKFRTMHESSHELREQLREQNETEGLFKMAEDPRITRVGRLLRRSSLDELPQLWNVLRGDMSLVGPRPLVIEEDRKITGWGRRRLHLTPGMTGNWQILGSTRVPLNEMVKIDYLYIANWSLWGDIKALLRTLPHVLGRRGL
ncbi:MAG: sugar transferase [Solirubrobacteraceae bacterium]